MLAAFIDLLLPQRCALCGAGEEVLCKPCTSLWSVGQKCGRILGHDIYAARPYDTLAANVIVGAKDHQRRWLLPLIVTGVVSAVRCLLPADQRPLGLVPMPSRRASLRKRGDDVLLHVARQAAKELRGEGINAIAVPLLEHGRKVRDQSGLTSQQRQRNLHGAFTLTGTSDRALIVVDDVITTGASLQEAFRALAPLHLLGGACAAATSLRSREPGSFPGREANAL